jgi:DHA1 family L-arabinose/isopropyl-beta-D-thiogalactopyranoside export protein-like MFS transporter
MERLLIVMFAAFVAQTTEYLPIGLIPAIRQDLGVSEAAVGVLVTGYAWIAAATAVPFTLLTGRLDRRTLLLGLIAVITLSNALGAISPGYAMLAATRMLTALTHGVFWSILAALATRLAPEVSHNRALAVVFSGISLAIVLGVPAANFIGQWLGWRSAFLVLACLGLAVLVAGLFALPPMPMREQASPPKLGFNNRKLGIVAVVTLLSVTAHFCGYTYIVPLLTDVAAITPDNVPWFLLAFGLAGAGGTLLAGWFSGKPSTLALAAIAGVTVSQALMAMTGRQPISSAVEMVIWGGSVSILIVGLQGWVLTVVPDNPDAGSAVYVTAFNGGIGLGAALGGIVLDRAEPAYILLSGAALGWGALIAFAIAAKRKLQPSHDKRP